MRRPPRRLLSRLHPAHLGVLAAVVYGFVVLRAQRLPANDLNDSSVHAQMVRWALARERDGHLPFDGWYPSLGLGSPHFHQYQSLGHIVAATIGLLVGATTSFRWCLYVLLALWPAFVYFGARLLELDRLAACGAALAAPFVISTPGYGAEHGSYTWQGYGLWSQLWGMLLLPIAWGVGYRAVDRGRGYALAASSCAITLAFHFLTGYQAFLGLVVAVVVGAPRTLVRRALRAAGVGAAGLCIALWVVVPLLSDVRWVNRSTFDRHSIFTDSYGARRVLHWLFSGQLFDASRFPVLSLLLGLGALVAIARFRRDRPQRFVLVLWVLMLAIYFGRPTWHGLLSVLPGSGDMLFHRFILGFQVAGLLLIGQGWATAVRFLQVVARRVRIPRLLVPIAASAAALALLLPAINQNIELSGVGADEIAAQRGADATDGADLAALVAEAEEAGGGRVYAGLANGWGRDYRISYVPVYSVLANLDADAVGFTLRTSSLATDVEPYFDDTNPADFALYAVRWVLLPDDRQPPAGARLVDRRGRHRLYEMPGVGYLRVGDVATVVAADRATMAASMLPFLRGDLPSRDVYPAVAYAGSPAAVPTADLALPPAGPAGEVSSQVDLGMDGRYVGRVVAHRDAAVVLASSYHPGWTVLVDGHHEQPFMVAPGFVAVRVAPGEHTVEFVFRPYQRYWLMWLLGALALVVTARARAIARLGLRVRRRRRSGGARREVLAGDP